VRLFPNGSEAFTQSEIRVNLSPLPSVPHVCEVELTISLVLHAGETSFKVRGNSIGMGTRISGSEVEVALMPSGEDVRQVKAPPPEGRWLLSVDFKSTSRVVAY